MTTTLGTCGRCGSGLWEDLNCWNVDCEDGYETIKRELADLEAIFIANGGRGVDVADMIDTLRRRLGELDDDDEMW